ncbi:DUF6221 family protein [Kutzneria buriramensis]|uniref:Uncharacterized protein n=1 Tax=Kutzneria buriramensis TaxID=1045776 RepID=A0A3E0HEJ4_9PSEU|nr:DUF6221 family protein [Kutzneria buriramensis]REH43628.1 hypothetical protein BCF44_109171 [Kutzneria buriramensis]
MDELIEFLNLRYKEDADIALDVPNQRWEATPSWGVQTFSGKVGPFKITPEPVADSCRMPGAAAHMARHDPDRELREVMAKRRVVEHYVATRRALAAAEGTPLEAALKIRLGAYENAVRILGAVYADHADYRMEWAA